ncbi:hypothetical protein SA87_08305 [Hydrogenibacillus schlegelii]|nr:hypothetical protein SA87_08305 [Hydrogenibacillus schlegelii]
MKWEGETVDHLATLWAVSALSLAPLTVWALVVLQRMRHRRSQKQAAGPDERRKAVDPLLSALQASEWGLLLLEKMGEGSIVRWAGGRLWVRLGFDPEALSGRPLEAVVFAKEATAAAEAAFAGRDGAACAFFQAGWGLMGRVYPVRREGTVVAAWLLVLPAYAENPWSIGKRDERAMAKAPLDEQALASNGAQAPVRPAPEAEADPEAVFAALEALLASAIDILARHPEALRQAGRVAERMAALQALLARSGWPDAGAPVREVGGGGAAEEAAGGAPAGGGGRPGPIAAYETENGDGPAPDADEGDAAPAGEVPSLADGNGFPDAVFSAPAEPETWRVERLKKRIDAFSTLTQREKEVLLELSLGKRNREIAETLFISEHTVKNHISNIFAKLGVSDRVQLLSLLYRGRPPDRADG